MQLNRQQLSLLITIFSMAIVVLGLYNIHLGGQQEEDEYVVELVMSEEMLEELIKEEEQKLEELQNQDPIKSHMAFNETAKPSYGNPEPLKTLEEILEEKAMNTSDDPSEYTDVDSDYVAKVKELAQQMVVDYKNEHGTLTPEFKEELQVWYNKDKGQSMLNDLLELLALK